MPGVVYVDNRLQAGVFTSTANNGIIADLSKGTVLKPLYGNLEMPRILALGDSITAGEHRRSPYPGGYRVQMWDRFLDDGLSVDFVGSQQNAAAPDSLGDVPLLVLTRGLNQMEANPGDYPPEQQQVFREMHRVWQELQANLTTLSTNNRQIIAEDSGHFIQNDQPGLVVDAIQQMIEMSADSS